MALRKAKVGQAQKLTGYGILALLGLIVIWLLIQQSRFNPAVTAALRAPLLPGKTQAASGQSPAATAGFFPEVSGFTPLTPAASYNRENLSDKINGKAELYLSAGFKEMSCRSFSLSGLGEAHVEVFLYDMGSAPNAYAVFSSQRRPGSPGIPLTANAYSTANALFFTQGRFYVEIVADRQSEELLDFLKTYAAALLARLPSEGEKQDATALFPRDGLSPDSLRLNPADAFGLEGFNNVVTGEYTLKGGKGTAFMATRGTPEQARADMQRYLDFLAANGYQKVETPGPQQNIWALVLDDSFELVFVQGRTLAGVHDATSLDAALELAAQLEAALKGKP
jgi:hypothetical protein